MLQLITATR